MGIRHDFYPKFSAKFLNNQLYNVKHVYILISRMKKQSVKRTFYWVHGIWKSIWNGWGRTRIRDRYPTKKTECEKKKIQFKI